MDNGIGIGDLLAAMNYRNNDDGNGWGGCWIWVIFLFFIFAMFGNGLFGGRSYTEQPVTQAELCNSQNFMQLENSVRGVQSGLCDGFYAQNTTLLTQFGGLQKELCQDFSGVRSAIAENRFASQQCCCETQRAIEANRYEAQKNTCDITTAIHNEAEQTRALINQNTMQALRDKLEDRDRELMAANFQISQQAQNAYLVGELRPCAKPTYLTCSPYQAMQYPYGTCGQCGSCNG